MQPMKKQNITIALALVSSIVAGCSLISTNPEGNGASNTASSPVLAGASITDENFVSMVAQDIVSVLRQVDQLVPERTTLGTSLIESIPQDAFAQSLKVQLESAGYALRSTGGGTDTVPISYDLKVANGVGTGSAMTYTVLAGDVAVRRTYLSESEGKVTPVGAMQVRGADARNLVLDNDIFSAPPSASTDAPATHEPPVKTVLLPDEQIVLEDDAAMSGDDASLASNGNSPLVVTPSVEADLSADSTISGRATDSSLLALVAPSVPAIGSGSVDISAFHHEEATENFMDLQQSNFADVFAEMGIVREKVLTFPNDSTFMGSENKARLSAMLEGFNEKSDVLSVIGCSMGATNHAGGQEALARGRALRVRDELLYAGVPEQNILEEGCWAEEAFDQRMPRRGVVVTLKRRLDYL